LAAADVENFRNRLKDGVLGDTLSQLGTLKPGVMSPSGTVADALPLMRADRRGSVLICDENGVVGIFTERDLIRRVAPDADLTTLKISEVMTPDPFTYSPNDNIAYALNGMTAWGNRHLPICDENGTLTGFVSVRKVLGHIKERCDSGDC
jgi:CBS domain-containing protein